MAGEAGWGCAAGHSRTFGAGGLCRSDEWGIEFQCEHPTSPPCQLKASRRTNRTGKLLPRHQKAFKTGSVVHFASDLYKVTACTEKYKDESGPRNGGSLNFAKHVRVS